MLTRKSYRNRKVGQGDAWALSVYRVKVSRDEFLVASLSNLYSAGQLKQIR